LPPPNFWAGYATDVKLSLYYWTYWSCWRVYHFKQHRFHAIFYN